MQCLTGATDRPDHLLVDLSRQGDDDAFGELLSRHYRRCIDLATMYLRNHWDAEDQVQIAMSKAHARLHQFQGEAEFATWLSRIVANQCLMFIRDRRRAKFVIWTIPRENRMLLPAESPAVWILKVNLPSVN